MAVNERARHALYERLEVEIGMDAATTLMEYLPPVGWADVATKRDIDELRLATKRDIDAVRVATKRDIDALGVATKRDIDALAVATKRDIDELAVATKRDIDALAVATKRDIDELRHDMQAGFEHQTDKLTAVLRGEVIKVLLAAFTLITGLVIALVRFT